MKNSKLNSKAFSLIELSIVVLIIGILIAGVTQGSRLIRQSRLKTAQNQTTSSAVQSIPDMILWLETTSDNSLTSLTNGSSPENGDNISSWNDQAQVSNKHNATQNTQANMPTYVSSGISVTYQQSNFLLAVIFL